MTGRRKGRSGFLSASHEGLAPLAPPPEAVGAPDTSAGAADAAAGAPDPVAESSDDRRQPSARLGLFAAECKLAILAVLAGALEDLNDLAGVGSALPHRIADSRHNLTALAGAVEELPQGRERELAHWRVTAIVLSIAIALPFEVYLTSLSLAFLDVADTWAVRLLSLGIALSLTLTGLIAAELARDGRGFGPRNAALSFLALLVLALATLRYGVMSHNDALWEQAGALVALAASAAAFALWVGFVDNRVHRAQAEQERHDDLIGKQHELRGEREQLALLRDRAAGIPAEIVSVRDAAVAAVREAGTSLDREAASWWTSYQAGNALAAPDIRIQLDGLRASVEQSARDAAKEIDDRAAAVGSALNRPIDDRETP